MTAIEEEQQALDVSDLDRYMGVPMEPGELKEPVHVNDIRRWVQGMHYPNPLHYDDVWAAEGRFGGIVAPQSFAVATDTSHGCAPSQVGHIPNSHLIFGGDEWWFFGPRIVPGDHLVCHRMPFDYRVTDTKFAGRTCFQRGDTLYINQRGERVALQRSTSIRYAVRAAKSENVFRDDDPEPQWTDEQLIEFQNSRRPFIRQIRDLGHEKRPFKSVQVGEQLATNILGPHSLASFTTEWRAINKDMWGAVAKGPTTVPAGALGYTPEMAGFEGERGLWRVNPELIDGAYYGPSRGHLQPRWARHVGMGRGYGYGASMGAWILDYVGAWAGEWGFITHSAVSYRHPAFTGDVTFIDGEVIGTKDASDYRHVERRRGPRAVVRVEMRNQDDKVMA